MSKREVEGSEINAVKVQEFSFIKKEERLTNKIKNIYISKFITHINSVAHEDIHRVFMLLFRETAGMAICYNFLRLCASVPIPAFSTRVCPTFIPTCPIQTQIRQRWHTHQWVSTADRGGFTRNESWPPTHRLHRFRICADHVKVVTHQTDVKELAATKAGCRVCLDTLQRLQPMAN